MRLFFCFEAGVPGFSAMPPHLPHIHTKISMPQEGCTSTSKAPG